MSTHRPSLLCELHAHSTWSDGGLSVRQLADLYGRAGFDVLCVTDHALRGDDPWLAGQGEGACYVHAGNHPGYLAEIEAEAERARAVYGLLLLPGLELTYNHPDPREAAHALAVGLRTFVSPDPGIRIALEQARAAGAALVAVHPHGEDPDPVPLRTTRRFFHDWEELAPLVDRVELFNRDTVFGWVAGRRFPVVACGDFHRPEHLLSWKTLLTCDKDERAVVDFLTSPAPAYLLPFSAAAGEEQAAA